VEGKLSPATLLAHAGKTKAQLGEPTIAQMVLASAYHLAGDVDEAPFRYGRQDNPTWRQLELAFGGLTGGHAVAFASGMAAAVATLETLAEPDRGVAIVEDGYYGVRRAAGELAAARGSQLVLLPSAGAAAVSSVEESRPGLVWLESPTNPGLNVTDIRAVAEATIRIGARLVLDETLVTPLGREPFAYGAEAAVYSATKYISGHSDLLLGLSCVTDEAIAERLRGWRNDRGAIPGAFESWLCLRGMQTLELRYTRQCENALQIASWLQEDGRLSSVRYPGLTTDPGHELARRDMNYFGGIVVAAAPGAAAADRVVGRLSLFADATSFGGLCSSVDRRARWRGETAPPGLLRFSIGCEAVADLIADLDQALAG
jgi:cystathionine gamma-lyase